MKARIVAETLLPGARSDEVKQAPALTRLVEGGLPIEAFIAYKIRRWLQASEQGIIRAMRHLDQLEQWEITARDRVAGLSGQTAATDRGSA